LATATPVNPVALPITGSDASWKTDLLILGLLAIGLATLMFWAGCAVHDAKLKQR
jgi:hypothetical protein